MKKLALLLALSIIHCPLSIPPVFAGTNAAVTFRTNDFGVNPTNLWRSNSALLIDALTNAGFTGGGASPSNISPAAILPGPIGGINFGTPNPYGHEIILNNLLKNVHNLVSIGASLTAGAAAFPTNVYGFAWVVAAKTGFTPYNYGTGGLNVADFYYHAGFWNFGGPSPTNSAVTFSLEDNDVYNDPYSTNLVSYRLSEFGDLFYMLTYTNKAFGSNMTILAGSWTNTASAPAGLIAVPYLWNGVYTRTPGAALSNTVYGSSIIVGFMENWTNGGSFSVTIDGTTVGTNVENIPATWAVNPYQAPAAVVYTNFALGPHSVVVSNLSTTNYVFIEYFSSPEMAAQTPFPVYVINSPSPSTNATAQSLISCTNHNQVTFQVVQTLDYLQFPVTLVDAWSALQNITTYIGTNAYGNSHDPTNIGHAAIAGVVLEQMNNPAYLANLTVTGNLDVTGLNAGQISISGTQIGINDWDPGIAEIGENLVVGDTASDANGKVLINSGGGGGTETQDGLIVDSSLQLTFTNPAPTGVTIGTTAPDTWFQISSGSTNYKVPAWKNH